MTASSRRFSSVTLPHESTAVGSPAVTVTVEGVKGEDVQVCAIYAEDMSLHCTDVSFEAHGGKKRISIGVYN